MREKFLTLVFLFLVLGNLLAKPPEVSCNFEHGSRHTEYLEPYVLPSLWIETTEKEELESWAYNYHKGYFKFSHPVSKRLRYERKYDYIWKDFIKEGNDNKNILNYYRTFF